MVKVDRRIRWHYTTTILRLRIGARLTRYRNCKFHNFARAIRRHADGISRYSVPPSAGPLLPLDSLRALKKPEVPFEKSSETVGSVVKSGRRPLVNLELEQVVSVRVLYGGAQVPTFAQRPGARFTKYLTIYHTTIVSLS